MPIFVGLNEGYHHCTGEATTGPECTTVWRRKITFGQQAGGEETSIFTILPLS